MSEPIITPNPHTASVKIGEITISLESYVRLLETHSQLPEEEPWTLVLDHYPKITYVAAFTTKSAILHSIGVWKAGGYRCVTVEVSRYLLREEYLRIVDYMSMVQRTYTQLYNP